jgi:hypothetical protein
MLRPSLAVTLLLPASLACTQQTPESARNAVPASADSRAAAGGTDKPSATLSLASMQAARKLVRSGKLGVEVARYDEAAAKLQAIAETHGGYVADTQSARNEQGKRHGTLTIRVPADHFAAALAAVKELGQVRDENVSAQDVTKAYTDLETRLGVKRQTAARLVDILKTRAAKLSEVLEAERELARVTEEIEQMEGERRFYDQQVALSTITAELYEPEAIVRRGTLAPIKEAFRDSLRVLSVSFAALVYIVVFLTPWLLIFGVAGWIGRRLWRKRTP